MSRRFCAPASACLGLLALGSAPLPAAHSNVSPPALQVVANAASSGQLREPAPLQVPEAPAPVPTPDIALADGVLMVVSIPSQQAFVFKKGDLWKSTTVSTGKRGNDTPLGTFTILQKKKLHHSTLYEDAPMPFMQRLTWDGVAVHAGRVPGYPASHGCIRVPKKFAEHFYEITNFSSTVVVVTDKPVHSASDARKLV